ncbi:MAG: UDP-N-acetylmuramoyl-L-alanine--D-glutamate ligase [Candidatus Aminicenantaceae bacterium]
MNLKDKNVLVVGLSKTGEALCKFLLNKGASVTVSELKNNNQLSIHKAFWKQRGVTMESGEHKIKTFLNADLIIPSPGVPMIPELRAAKEKGIKIISEIELAYQFLKGKIVGITGSNGKSTTATLTHKILKEGGLKAYLAGNIGTPLISFVDQSRDDHVYVIEISSFQLQHIERFKVFVSILLNITPDHLDWHSSFDEYYEAKKKLVVSQYEEDIAILNLDDPLVRKLKNQGDYSVYGFSRKIKPKKGCYIDNDNIILSSEKNEIIMKTSEIPLKGIHNQENVMASILAGHLFHIQKEHIKNSIKSFQGLEHRLEKVTSINGIEFYNDSKATNVDAALKSIDSFNKNIILILGGRDKEGDFKKLKRSVEKRVKKILLIGEATEKIKKALKKTVPMDRVSCLKEAVNSGYFSAKNGDIVLLAPACTSFDMFENFEQRGRIFKKEIFEFKKILNNE